MLFMKNGIIIFILFCTKYLTSLIVLQNFKTDVSIKNFSLVLIIDNFTLDTKSNQYEAELYFHILNYEIIFSRYYPIYPFGVYQIENKPLDDKLQVTFISDKVLVIPKVNYLSNGYYQIKGIFVEEGMYQMLLRLECGSIDYMSIQRNIWLGHNAGSNSILTYKSCYVESRSIINNFTIEINNDILTMTENNDYCTSTQAFHGRFYINNIDFYDIHQHDGDIRSTFKPYGCRLRELSNSTEILSLLYNQHIIFLGDSTIEAVYRGILERLYGTNTFMNEYNSAEWRNNSIKYKDLSIYNRVSKRLFDIDKCNVRLSFMFDGASLIIDDYKGAVVENFTVSVLWEYYMSELRRIIRESIHQCRPITLLFNSGLHDIYSVKNLTEYHLYERNLDISMTNLKIMIANEKLNRTNTLTCSESSIETYFFWVSTVPPLGDRICSGGIVRYLNKIASIIAHKHDFRVLDVYSLLTGFPQNSYDGFHCQWDYINGPVYSSHSCHMLVHSYLHAIINKLSILKPSLKDDENQMIKNKNQIKRKCSTVRKYIKRILNEDYAWIAYLNQLYKVNINDFDKIQTLSKYLLSQIGSVIFYRYADVQIILIQNSYPNWRIGISNGAWGVDVHYEDSIRGNRFNSISSYSWVEVHHFASRFFPTWGIPPYNEGYSTGYYLTSHLDNNSYVPYGCWFHEMKGTGVYINVGNTLTVINTRELFQVLGLNEKGCINNIECDVPYTDKYICTKALALNYDSVVLTNGGIFREIIRCDGLCATIPINSSCPNDVQLRGGYNYTLPCPCNNKYPLMNCGEDYGKPEYYNGIPKNMININRRFTCVRIPSYDYKSIEKDFELNIAFTLNILKLSSLNDIKRNNIEVALNKIAHSYQLVVDIDHSTNFNSFINDGNDDYLTNSLGYTLLPNQNNIHPENKPVLKKAYIHNKTIELAITSNTIIIHDIKVGILAIASVDEWTLDLISTEYELILIKDLQLIEWIIDEAMCLRNQDVNIIIVVNQASFNLNKYIYEHAYGYIDLIISNSHHSNHASTCNGRFHDNTTYYNHTTAYYNNNFNDSSNNNDVWMNGLVQISIDLNEIGLVNLKYLTNIGMSIRSDTTIII